ncbi:ARM repeat-containing protein [Epithele typhae]|uniref:ARM repeat-containing protein n=1 Tax=Epithele typhae TaxID=378194 RepID=UPI0020088863|nr:ARM repeat-containing protein [Epithele typhae]KAH9912340.1 ARM repeat-containing protein [Epithele typhae]
MSAAFLPVLPQDDVARAAQLIQQTYAPQTHPSSDDQRRLQQELYDIQRRPEAWGLVLPFLSNPDPNVQFFGAHTLQVKIARDWDSVPEDAAEQLQDMVLQLTGRAVTSGQNKVILRKLFVAITTLAMKLHPRHPSRWPDWLRESVAKLSSMGVSREPMLDFLAIVSEEISSADLLPPTKSQMQTTLNEAAPMVVEAISGCISQPPAHRSASELNSALKCLQAWMQVLPANQITPLIPQLLGLMVPTVESPPDYDEATFVGASDALQEVLSSSALADGMGPKTLTEPLLLWLDRYGGAIVQATVDGGFVDGVSHNLCKLLVALGDHSAMYFATNIAAPARVSHLVQTFLRLLLAYTALPGFYGADEEESEMTLGFWYLFQEALWNSDYGFDVAEDGDAGNEGEERERDMMPVAKAVYTELVSVLRRKVVWPTKATLATWTRDQRDKYQSYRREVGDTLINAYYVLKDDMLAFYVNDVMQRLATQREQDGWEEIEGTLHCVMAVQEAVPVEDSPHLRHLFGPDVLSRLPKAGDERVRRTALHFIGSFASWFTTQPSQVPGSPTASPLMNAITYVVSALPDPTLCLFAANALRDLCDANRTALAPHISAFGELHAGLTGIPDSEKAKVLQSIASVIQALPPAEEIPPVEAIVGPVVAKLFDALQGAAGLPDDARQLAVQQLETLTGVARGLTRVTDSLLALDESPDVQAAMQEMAAAREDPRVLKLREAILEGVRRLVDMWSTDATVSDALSDLFKAITALPSDVTLISLPAPPLLELVCVAAQKQLTAVWLTLTTMLIIQLNPPSLLPATFKQEPTPEAQEVARNVLSVLLQTVLTVFSQDGVMASNPDIVQAFFGCMDSFVHHFLHNFYRLPPDLFNALIQCATSALALQERYSLASTCTFLAAIINRTCITDDLGAGKTAFAQTHGAAIMRAVLFGFAGVAPRSVMQNLIELLSTMITRYPLESKQWITAILFADDFYPCRATTEAKNKFIKTVFGTRSIKRTRDAAQQFTLIARGLEGSNFGYATAT